MSEPSPGSPPPPFSPSSTGLWAIVIAFLFLLVQSITAAMYLTAAYPGVSEEEMRSRMAELIGDGTLIAMVTLATTLVCSAMIWSITKRRFGPYAASYLGLTPFSMLANWRWFLTLGALLIAADVISVLIDRPVVTEDLLVAFSTADSKLLFLLAICFAAPVFEELFFRGFLFQGLRQTPFGNIGAIVAIAFLWASVHFQYDAYGMVVIFLIGVLLGFARWQSGSLLLPITLHAANNLVASAQLWMLV